MFFRPGSRYVERLWLPLLGPTSTALLRVLAEELDEKGSGTIVEASRLARGLGLGAGTGVESALSRAIRRLERFRLVKAEGDVLRVRTEVPPLSDHDVSRLPDDLRTIHQRLTHARTTDRQRGTRPAGASPGDGSSSGEG